MKKNLNGIAPQGERRKKIYVSRTLEKYPENYTQDIILDSENLTEECVFQK